MGLTVAHRDGPAASAFNGQQKRGSNQTAVSSASHDAHEQGPLCLEAAYSHEAEPPRAALSRIRSRGGPEPPNDADGLRARRKALLVLRRRPARRIHSDAEEGKWT